MLLERTVVSFDVIDLLELLKDLRSDMVLSVISEHDTFGFDWLSLMHKVLN